MSGMLRCFAVDFWTRPQRHHSVLAVMARKLRIRVAFEPSRLGSVYLQHAYETVAPVSRRSVRKMVEVSGEVRWQNPLEPSTGGIVRNKRGSG